MVSRRSFLKLAAVALLGPTVLARAAQAVAGQTGAAFQSLEPPIDFADPSCCATEVQVGSRLQTDGLFLFGTAYRQKASPADLLEKVALFSFEVERDGPESQAVRRKPDGETSLIFYGHETEKFGKATEFRHLGGVPSLKIQHVGGRSVAYGFSPRGERTELDPSSLAYREAMQLADTLYRRAMVDVEANKIYIQPPSPPRPAGERLWGVMRRVLGL